MRHTPGPWKADVRGGCIAVYPAVENIGCLNVSPDRFVHYVDGRFVDGRWTVPAEKIANAQLIAAAPETKEQRDELLEALEDLRKELRDNPDVKIMARSLPAEIAMAAVTRKADAAIAKVKGEGDDGE